MNNYLTDISNILVIGCGGAGLRAAIEVKKNNLSVKVLGKRPKSDAHTVLAAGGINASFGNLDHCDSWEEHFADTFLEGYKVGDPDLIEIMAKKAIEIEPENPSYLDTIGWVYFKLSDFKKAKKYISQSVQLNDKNAIVLEHLGDVLMETDETDEAVEFYKKALLHFDVFWCDYKELFLQLQ